MPEHIEIKSVGNPTWEEWFIVEAAAASSDKMPEIMQRQHESGKIEVVLTLNGIEVSFLKAVAKFEGQLEELIRMAAHDQVMKRVGQVMDKLETLETDVADLISSIVVKPQVPTLVSVFDDKPER